VSRCPPGRYQASPSYHRVATHKAASASYARRVEITALQDSLHAAARTFASHPGLAAGCFVERAFRGIRRRTSLRSKLDGRTGNLPSQGLSPRQSRQLSWLHERSFKRHRPRAPWSSGYPDWGFLDLESARGMQHRGDYRTLRRATDRDSPTPRETEWGLHRLPPVLGGSRRVAFETPIVQPR